MVKEQWHFKRIETLFQYKCYVMTLFGMVFEMGGGGGGGGMEDICSH